MAEIKGKIIAVLPLASGVSNRTGNRWESQDYVIEEQNARYPQRVVFKVFGSEKIQQFALQLGDVVTVKLELGAREHNGKWYNDINCWSVERAQTGQQTQQMQPQNYAPAGQWQQPAPQPQQGYAAPQQPLYPQQQPQGGYQQPAQQQKEILPF